MVGAQGMTSMEAQETGTKRRTLPGTEIPRRHRYKADVSEMGGHKYSSTLLCSSIPVLRKQICFAALGTDFLKSRKYKGEKASRSGKWLLLEVSQMTNSVFWQLKLYYPGQII